MLLVAVCQCVQCLALLPVVCVRVSVLCCVSDVVLFAIVTLLHNLSTRVRAAMGTSPINRLRTLCALLTAINFYSSYPLPFFLRLFLSMLFY